MDPMFTVDRLWPDPAAGLDLDAAFADLPLPAPPPGRPWIGLNMVTSLDGRAQRDGTADEIGDRADRRLMRLLRVPFDAVAIGIGTLRAVDGWTDLPADLADRPAGGRTFAAAAGRADRGQRTDFDRSALVHDRPAAPGGGRAGRPTAGPRGRGPGRTRLPHPEPDWLAGVLRDRGIGSVLLEGGPTVNARFHAAGLIDELFWTVGPWLLGGEGLPMIAPEPPTQNPRPATLVSAHRHGDELFLRYRFGTSSSG